MKRFPLFILTLVSLLFLASNLSAQSGKRITVAQDGSGDFKLVQQAFDAVPLKNRKPVTIFIKNGIYQEKLTLDTSKSFVTVIGEDKFKTILTYNDHTGKISPSGATINTRTSFTFVVKANDIRLENITIRNEAGFDAGQAVGLEVLGDRAVIINCRIAGHQDILFTSANKSRQYYKDCYIEGTTDFIFGSSKVWFEKCHIHSKKNSHITAASTPKEHAYGYVFNECIFTADSNVNKVTLGRPWQPYSSVTYLNCFLDRHIIPAGWDNWKNTENEKTARYSEYNNYGPGADTSARVKWSRQLTGEEAKKITFEAVMGDWKLKL
ncbi:MAG: pectin esterase [Segetibacter sp.]|nr:pectin esterase [Segetibacter sp.]